MESIVIWPEMRFQPSWSWSVSGRNTFFTPTSMKMNCTKAYALNPENGSNEGDLFHVSLTSTWKTVSCGREYGQHSVLFLSHTPHPQEGFHNKTK